MRNLVACEEEGWHFWLRLFPAAVFLFILPINHTIALRLTALLLAWAIAVQVIYRKHSTLELPLKIPIFSWAALALLSLLWAADPVYSLREVKDEIAYAFITFFTFFVLSKNRKAFLFFIATITVGFLFLSGTIALAHTRFGEWRAEGFPGNVGTFSTYLVTVLPFLVLAIIYNLKHKWLAYVSFVALAFLLLYTGYLTLNRAIWPATLLSGIIFGVLYFIKAERPRAKKSALLVLFVFSGMALFQFISVTEEKSLALQQPSSITLSISKDLRIPLWRYTAEKIADNPVFGAGFGKRVLENDFKAKFSNTNLWHAHNLLLNYALQLGVAGVAVLVFLFLSIYREFWRLYCANDEKVYLLGICGIALVTGVLAKNMTDDFFVRDNALLFWALVGMSLGFGNRQMAVYNNQKSDNTASLGSGFSPKALDRSDC